MAVHKVTIVVRVSAARCWACTSRAGAGRWISTSYEATCAEPAETGRSLKLTLAELGLAELVQKGFGSSIDKGESLMPSDGQSDQR